LNLYEVRTSIFRDLIINPFILKNTYNRYKMKKAIVVGATSGIGKGIARLLIANGYKVGITGRRTLLLEELKKENPDQYFIKTFDVRNAESISDHLNELIQEMGGLDLLVISSGTGNRIDHLDFEIEKRAIDTNVCGFTAIAVWTFNYFEQQKYGHLVDISSIAGLRGNRFAPAYSASKAFQINYLQGLRQKAVKLRLPIYITDIRPGFVDTAMAQGDYIFWVSSVEKASRQIYRSITAKRKVAYITRRWALMALVMNLLPDWIYNKA
jgi:short-subunit dehydrogenase